MGMYETRTTPLKGAKGMNASKAIESGGKKVNEQAGNQAKSGRQSAGRSKSFNASFDAPKGDAGVAAGHARTMSAKNRT